MPLTAAKVAHIKANIAKVLAGRSQQVILTLRTPAGGTTTLTVNAIWRPMGDYDSTLTGATNQHAYLGGSPDIQAIFNLADVSLPQMRSCISATLPAGSPGAEPAQVYILSAVEPFGIPPGGDRLFTQWTRQH